MLKEKKTLQDATMVRNYNVIHCTPTYSLHTTYKINCAIGEVKVIFLFDLSLSSGLRKFYFYWNFRFRCNDFTIFHVLIVICMNDGRLVYIYELETKLCLSRFRLEDALMLPIEFQIGC